MSALTFKGSISSAVLDVDSAACMVACLVGSSKQLAMYNAREATKVPLARRETQYGRRRDAQYRRRREVQCGWVERCTDTVRTESDGIHKFTRSDHWLSVEAAAE